MPWTCPDGGACHHDCSRDCWRVGNAGPLSGVYPENLWPVSVKCLHGVASREERIEAERLQRIKSASKRERTRLLRAEIWMYLAVKAEIWAREVEGRSKDTIPFEEWPADDPFRMFMATYGLEPADIVRALQSVGDQIETKSMAVGYADNWTD